MDNNQPQNKKSIPEIGFKLIKTVFNLIKNLTRGKDFDLYLETPIAPYLLTNQETNRTYSELDMLIDQRNIEELREFLIENGLYNKDEDTKQFVKDGNDYGLKFDLNNVKVSVAPFIISNGIMLIHRYKDNFITEKRGANYLAQYGDLNSVSMKYIITENYDDQQLIDTIKQLNVDKNVSDVKSQVVKEVPREYINNTTAKEVLTNSIVSFVYNNKMNIPDDKMDGLVTRLYNQPYENINNRLNQLTNTKEMTNNQKIVQNNKVKKLTPPKPTNLGFTSIASTMIILGLTLCILAILIKVI